MHLVYYYDFFKDVLIGNCITIIIITETFSMQNNNSDLTKFERETKLLFSFFLCTWQLSNDKRSNKKRVCHKQLSFVV